MKIVQKVKIIKPVSEVFNFVTDVTNAPQWAGLIEAVIVTSSGPILVGSHGINRMKLLWKRAEVGWLITELEQDRRFIVKSTSGPVEGVYDYVFKPSENGTILSLSMEVVPKGYLKFLELVFNPTLSPQISRDLEILKGLLEGKLS
ncbi:MAG: SRPBCC family protein [Chloroflexi bacterium]|uniref:SRPBCC family protein n=1 Tax=Candidatus Chlorohelix allophototropha TaxID=3003348 RepID=A0A8T7M7R0_9CHLR|nr:SRPBCC family protein [Chloroflexota bacterium]WJW69887.1 SRPBCC family protein [Chloroflexota bacterium L227-S17]